MQKKGMWAIAIIIVLIVIGGGVYALNHKSSTPSTSSTNTSSSTTTAAAVNNSVLTTKTNSSVGQYLADPSGKALYTYNGDNANMNMSMCMGSCLATWPAYIDSGATTGLPTNVGVIKRSDNGKEQYTYKGLPLYYFVSDSTGQVTGNGVGGFSVAKP